MNKLRSIPVSIVTTIRSAWRYTFGDPRRAMIALFAAACTAVSLSVALAYAHYTVVPGWQLWTWLAAVIGILLALIPPLTSRLPRRIFWILFGLLAAALGVAPVAIDQLAPWLARG